MSLKIQAIVLFSAIFLMAVACVKMPPRIIDEDETNTEEEVDASYLYPFDTENTNIVAEISILTNENVNPELFELEIPPLKYNKSWLFLFTQDDCSHSAYSRTWASIHGKPLSESYFYDAVHLIADDLPPDAYCLNKTLGSTDGAGNEVRFSFTTTLAPEWDYMNAEITINKGYTENYYRFYMKNGLVWTDVLEMLNYGTGIAFRDVNTDKTNSDSIRKHFDRAQTIILQKLSGRGCKMLAEPDGNKEYITAASAYEPIQTMVAQEGAVTLYPFQVKDDLQKILLERTLFSSVGNIKTAIENQLKLKKEDRIAIHAELHRTSGDWTDFLLWLNYNYGKDGDDSVWVPNMEEYYEYNYYRIHSTMTKSVEDKTLKITISIPSGQYFYYPSITVNVKGLKKAQITSVTAGDPVTGLSYGEYEDGTMINIDCRKHLMEHAIHYVEKYEKNKTASNARDAKYFVNMLKASSKKNALLGRID
ncbi:MAG: hypothetical protein PHS48_07030 [Bacteroidales bacterium]|nr:hypothetical protein [Bacteroidales bacterium]